LNNLEKYNKLNMVSERQKFFGKHTTEKEFDSYFELLYKLGYCLNPDDANYKIGKRFVVKDGSTCWNTSNSNKKINKWYYDRKIGKLSKYEANALLTLDDIRNHFKGSAKPKMKKKLYDEYNTSKWDIARINLNNINNHIFGTTVSLETNILWFDIDDHDGSGIATNTVKELLNFLNCTIKDVIMIEQNQFNGGYHLFLQVPYTINNPEFYTKLTKALKDNNLSNVDCNFTNRILRFPLSYEYLPVKKEDFLDFIQFQETYKSYDEFMKSVDFTRYINPTVLSDIAKSIDNMQRYVYDTELQHVVDSFKFENVSKNMYLKKTSNHLSPAQLYWKRKKLQIKPKNKKFNNNIDSFKINSGNRYNTFSIMIPYCANCLNLSLNDTVYYLQAHCISSKDMAKWGFYGIKHNIEKYYNECKNNPQKSNFNINFISNQKYIPTELLAILNEKDVQEHITKHMMDYIRTRRGFLTWSDIKSKNLSIQLPFIFNEFIGTYYYQLTDLENKKERLINKKLINKIGFQFSDKHLKQIVEQSRLLNGVDYESSAINIQYLKKALFDLAQFTNYNLSYKKNWLNGFCKSYKASYGSVFNFFLRLAKQMKSNTNYNRIFQKIYLYINNIILILEITPLTKLYRKILNKNMVEMGIDPPPIEN